MRGTQPETSGLLQERRDLFARDDVLAAFAGIDKLKRAAFDQNLSGHTSGVVAAGHRIPVGTGAHKSDQLPLAHFLELPVLGEAVAAFTNRTYDVRRQRAP